MANKLMLEKRIVLKEDIIRCYRIDLSGSYVQVTGEVIDLTSVNNTAAQNPTGAQRALPGAVPGAGDIAMTAFPQGFDPQLAPNAVSPTLKNFVLRIYASGGTEATAQTYAANGLTSPVRFTITQKKKFG